MISSTMPSAKYSCSGPLMFWKGSSTRFLQERDTGPGTPSGAEAFNWHLPTRRGFLSLRKRETAGVWGSALKFAPGAKRSPKPRKR